MTTEKAAVRPSVPTARIVAQDEQLILMSVGDKRDLKVTAIPLLVNNNKTLSPTPNEAETAALLSALVTDKAEWSSSDDEIATVDENGTVCAVSAGSAKITVKSGEHEVIFNVLVEVAISDWASEEFLEYIERIGAYTELPLGTDGSAGPTAQYVTFGFNCPYGIENPSDDRYVYDNENGIDVRTITTYRSNHYAKGANDDEWYYSWGNKDKDRYYAYKIKPMKWRLLDREKGLLFPERPFKSRQYDYNARRVTGFSDFNIITKEYGIFEYYEDGSCGIAPQKDYANEEFLKNLKTLCDYGTSWARAYLDGGTYYRYSNIFPIDHYVNGDGNKPVYKKTDDGYAVCSKVETKMMNSYSYDYGYYNFMGLFTPTQYELIQTVDLDCGEGGNTQGRFFLLSEDDVKNPAYFPAGCKFCTPDINGNDIFLTRTKKKIDGKDTLCAVQLNRDGTFQKYIQVNGYSRLEKDENGKRYEYNTSDEYDIIPAICVAPAPHR